MNLSRRSALLAGLAAPTLGRAGPGGLAQLAAAAGLHYGSDSDTAIQTAPAAYETAFAGNCALLAPNMGWHRTAPLPGALTPTWEDPNIAFARQQHMRLTGGHLLWHKALPPAFLAADTATSARSLAASHIDMMARHYAGQVFSWNVVNEAIDTEHGTTEGLRRSPLLQKLGPSFITDAFQVARGADSRAVLTYNDTQFEMDTPYHATRRAALLRLLDRLRREGAPIDAVGLQTHLRLDGSRFDPRLYARFLAEIASRGLRILITEMDVFDIGVPGSIAQRDAAVAGLYRDALAIITDQPAVASVVTWGLSDRYTWLTPQTDPRYRRPDGAPARPLPLDDQFQPKPAYAALAAAFQTARPRHPA